MSIDQMLKHLRSELNREADSRFAQTMQGFSKEKLYPYGVPAAVVKKLAADAYREIRHWPDAGRNRRQHVRR